MPNNKERKDFVDFKSQIARINFSGIWGFILYASLCVIQGCKEPDIANLEILPDSEIHGLLNTDSSTVISFTLPDDSIRTDETSLNLLGIYNDPVFGLTKASVFTQVRMSAENVLFGDPFDLVIDSVILSLAYSGIYGNAGPLSFKVYELDENMYKDSNYYSGGTFLYKSTEIGSISNLVPDIYDSVLVGTSMEPPQLRIPLNKSTGDYLIKGSSDVYLTNTAFLGYFKGIYLVADTNNIPAQGDGSILYFNLLSPYSKITVYYQNAAEADTLKFDFPINNDCARMSSFNFNRTGNTLFYTDTLNGDNLLFVQSMSGARCKIKLPFLEEFIGKGKVAVNKAELIFNVNDNSTEVFPPHTSLFLTDIDSAGSPGFLIDQFEGMEHYGGSYNSTAKQYVFNITRHVQYLLTNFYEGRNYNFGLFLMAGGKAVNANRTVLKGNKNTGGGLKFRISYTPL